MCKQETHTFKQALSFEWGKGRLHPLHLADMVPGSKPCHRTAIADLPSHALFHLVAINNTHEDTFQAEVHYRAPEYDVVLRQWSRQTTPAYTQIASSIISTV